MEKLAVSVLEMAEMLGVNEKLAYELVRRPGFPVVRLGKKKIVIPVDGLRRWLLLNSGMGNK